MFNFFMISTLDLSKFIGILVRISEGVLCYHNIRIYTYSRARLVSLELLRFSTNLLYYEPSFQTTKCIYSILSLVRTPGDRRNLFALSGIRINRCLKYYKGFEGDRNSVRINESLLYM